MVAKSQEPDKRGSELVYSRLQSKTIIGALIKTVSLWLVSPLTIPAFEDLQPMFILGLSEDFMG